MSKRKAIEECKEEEPIEFKKWSDNSKIVPWVFDPIPLLFVGIHDGNEEATHYCYKPRRDDFRGLKIARRLESIQFVDVRDANKVSLCVSLFNNLDDLLSDEKDESRTEEALKAVGNLCSIDNVTMDDLKGWVWPVDPKTISCYLKHNPVYYIETQLHD